MESHVAGTAIAVFLEPNPRVVAFDTDLAKVQCSFYVMAAYDAARRLYGRSATDVLPFVLVSKEFVDIVSKPIYADMAAGPWNCISTQCMSEHAVFTAIPVPPDMPDSMKCREDRVFQITVNHTHPHGPHGGPFPLITMAFGAYTKASSTTFVPFVLTRTQQEELLCAGRAAYNDAVYSGPYRDMTPAIQEFDWEKGPTPTITHLP
jgi:hypothetical protein